MIACFYPVSGLACMDEMVWRREGQGDVYG
jgi:hypothetical protein